jgi:hypothetical protein
LPLIVQSQHARIGKDGETIKITDEEQGETRVRFIEISDVALFGNVSITTPALSALLEREIPVTFHTHGGWFRGIAHGVGHRNVEVRTAQYRMSFDEASCLRFANQVSEMRAISVTSVKKDRALANAPVCWPAVSIRVDCRLISSGSRGLHVEICSRWHCVFRFGRNGGCCGPPSSAAGCPDRASW